MSDRRTVKTLKQGPPEIIVLEVRDAKDSVPSTHRLVGYPGVHSERPSTILIEGVLPQEIRNVVLDFWILLSDVVDPGEDFPLGHSRLLLPCHLDRD